MTQNSFRILLCFFLFSEVCAAAANKTTNSSSANEVKSKQEAKSTQNKKKKLGVDQSDFMPAAHRFGLIVSYWASYDDLQQVKIKTVSHQVSFAGTYSFDQNWSSYAVVAASHETYGSNIVREHDTDQFHQISNVNLGAVYSLSNPLSFLNRTSNTLNISLPVSERSRIDKQVGNFSLTNYMVSHNWNNISVFNRLSANFLWNTQYYSIYNNDVMNRDWLVADSLGVTYMVLGNLGARFNFSSNMVRYLDGSWDLSFGNNFSVFSNLNGFQLFASMVNNSYRENDRIDLGYFDKYRRVFYGGVTYAF